MPFLLRASALGAFNSVMLTFLFRGFVTIPFKTSAISGFVRLGVLGASSIGYLVDGLCVALLGFAFCPVFASFCTVQVVHALVTLRVEPRASRWVSRV